MPRVLRANEGVKKSLAVSCCGCVVPRLRDAESLRLSVEFLHLGLTAKYQLTTALARLRERGNREAWVRDSLVLHQENNPSPPASPYPLASERVVINCSLPVNPNVQTRVGGGLKPRPSKARPNSLSAGCEDYGPRPVSGPSQGGQRVGA